MQQPEDDGKEEADEEAGREREEKADVAFAVMEIARRPPQPAAANARPEQGARHRQQQPDNHEKFSKLAPRRILLRRSQFLKTLLVLEVMGNFLPEISPSCNQSLILWT